MPLDMTSHFKHHLLSNLNMLSELFTNGLAEKNMTLTQLFLQLSENVNRTKYLSYLYLK